MRVSSRVRAAVACCAVIGREAAVSSLGVRQRFLGRPEGPAAEQIRWKQ
jgi:hypothetical protein